jgi:hypothetical protein
MRDTQRNLPKFTAEQRAMIMGSVDFFSLNFYTAHFVRAPAAGAPKAQVRGRSRIICPPTHKQASLGGKLRARWWAAAAFVHAAHASRRDFWQKPTT